MNHEDSIEKILKYEGNNVKVNLGGPESCLGRLVRIESDFLVVDTQKDGVCYYQLRHIKSVAIHADDHSKLTESTDFIKASVFVDVLKRLKHKRVKINRGGPESVEGILSNIFDNHLELTVNNDVVFVSIYHIKSVSHMGKSKSSGSKHSSGKKNSSKQQRSSGKDQNQWNHYSGNRNKNSKGSSSSGKRSNKNRKSSQNNPQTSRVYDALEEAQQSGTARYMHNDPSDTSGKSSKSNQSHHSKTTRRAESNRQRTSDPSSDSRQEQRQTRGSHSRHSSGRSRNSNKQRSRGSDKRSSQSQSRPTMRRGGWYKLT